MRKRSLLIAGGLGAALLTTAVWAKEEPGSGMTIGQRAKSLFGLIDRGQAAPPPMPPDMPAYPHSRPQHTTVAPGGNTGVRTGIFGQARSSGAAAMPTPPTPQRSTDGVAETDDLPGVSVGGGYQSPPARPGLLMQSRQGGVYVPRTPAGMAATRSAASQPAGAAANSIYGTAPSRTTSPAGTAATPQRIPTNGTPNPAAPITSSRRRNQPGANDSSAVSDPWNERTDDAPQSLADQPATDGAPQLIAETTDETSPAAAQASGIRSTQTAESEAFVPTVPLMVDESVPTQRPPLSNAPATLPRDEATAQARPLTNAGATATDEPTPIPIAGRDTGRTATIAQAADAATGNRAAVLAEFTSPDIVVETIGPRRISVGREAPYRIVVRNRGQHEARQVVVAMVVPDWAEVAEIHGTAGLNTSTDERAAGAPLQWQIDALAGRSEEELTLVLVPRRSEAFDLGVRWSCSPAAAATSIEVEEPRLHMAINGPSEVSYGEQRLYKLTVSNPGTGTAENVLLKLMPLTPGEGEPVSHRIGNLKAGDSTTVEVELTARQAGQLAIRTEAVAEGNLRAEAAADVVVRRAALDVAVAAPKLLFAGVPGQYEVRVRNAGDDQARNVRVSIALPSGAKLLAASPAPRGESGDAAWTIERLAPGAEQVITLKCAFDHGGVQQLNVAAAADGDLRKAAQAATDVQAVADLALDLIDAPGPVAVGAPVTFEIHVKNRGMKSAEGVDVVAYFSEGIEPEKAEGQGYELQPGMVVFKPLATVGAGQERVLRVTARATTAGNHRLRVELHGTNPQTQLSQEDATLFYDDESAGTVTSATPPPPFMPASTPMVLPTSATGAANAPGLIVPAAPRQLSNGLR